MINVKNKLFKKYFIKKSLHDLGVPHRLPNKNKYDIAIVIPCYNEFHFIFDTLESINTQKTQKLSTCLVIIVINNFINDKHDIILNNQQTYDKLILQKYKFDFVAIDCFTSDNAFNNKNRGVGTARKVGMDFALQYFQNEMGVLCCLDADTIIDKNYLNVVYDHFCIKNFNACTVNFKHQTSADEKLNEAIIKYEKILKETAYKIKQTGSPYGYVSLGSTIVCNAKSYISCGGMSSKQATEDFYFLQSLAKYTKIQSINEILVFPSSRSENRVYLGTGFRINEYLQYNKFKNLNFNEESFVEIKNIISIVEKCYGLKFDNFLQKAKLSLNMESYTFMIEKKIQNVWMKFHENCSSKKQFMIFFHQWFDALMIIQLLKKLNN